MLRAAAPATVIDELKRNEKGALIDSFFGSATPCASPPPRQSIFSNYSYWVHHLVNRDDQHPLAHAMASDFSVTCQCLSKRTIGFHYGSNYLPLSDEESPRPVALIDSSWHLVH
jgi:hypothetical protein